MKHEWRMSHIIRMYMIILMLIFLGIVIYLNNFALSKIRESEIDKETDLLENLVHVWDNMLENNTIFIENFLANNEALVKLNVAKTHEDKVYALQEIRDTLKEYAMLNYGMGEIFFYSEMETDNNYLIAYHEDSMITSKTMQERIGQILEVYKQKGRMKKWLIAEVDGQNCLIYISERNGNYIGCWSNVDYLISKVTKTSDSSYKFFVTDENGISRTGKYLNGQQIDLEAANYYLEESGEQYWQIAKKSDLIQIYFVEHLEKSSAEASIIQVRNIMVLMCGLLGALLLLLSGFLEYFLYRPIRKLVLKMMQISEGNFETKISNTSNLKEIRILNETFNQMVDEIKNLKLTVYEEKLREQKVRLQYLQIQIRPHFLVNGLNSIHTMIDMQNPDGAREMCRYLAKYFRFLYNKSTDLIVITEELEHVETYVHIQKIRRPNRIDFSMSVEESCHICLVPPLLLLTFVENSIKYGIDVEQQKNSISIAVFREDGMTQIMIRDSGPGFSAEILECMEHDRPIRQGDRECMGMRNGLERLRLFYGEAAEIHIYNENGAVVRIGIPM